MHTLVRQQDSRFSIGAPRVALLLLLAGELLALTTRFDTQSLSRVPSAWAWLMGETPQILRLAVTVALVSAVISMARRSTDVDRTTAAAAAPWQWPFLAVHGAAFAGFVVMTSLILETPASFAERPALWTIGWGVAGLATLAGWALAFWPASTWRRVLHAERRSLGWGVAVGAGSWLSGFATQELWAPLARVTFTLVTSLVHVIYRETVVDPQALLVGTPTFKVVITPQCSGYEGVGLILAFLSGYLWLFRKELRFPAALLLLPLGAITIWVVNIFRIVALIVIGTAGWREVARGGFHSQAGWIAFNIVALGFVALTLRRRWFTLSASVAATVPAPRESSDATTAYLAPFVAITATAMLTRALTGGFEWLYPLRVLSVAAVLWMLRGHYRAQRTTWSWSWWPVVIGGAAFGLWLLLIPGVTRDQPNWPAALGSAPWYWAGAWLLLRTAGYVIAAPLAEELAFRGFLRRWIVRRDFEALPMGAFTWAGFLISSVVFGLLHGSLWLAGTVTGMLFAVALYRRGALADAVQAHAITNGLIALYAFATGQWAVWS